MRVYRHVFLVFAIAASLALSCGGESTSLGGAKGNGGSAASGGAGSGATGGGASRTSGTTSESGNDSSTGGANGGTQGGVGAGGAVIGVGGSSQDAGLPCDLPKPPPISNPTPEQQELAALVHAYCVTLMRDNCLDYIGRGSFVDDYQTKGCSPAERLIACEQDRLWEHYYGIERRIPMCDDEWRTAIRCLTDNHYDVDKGQCPEATLFGGGFPPGPASCASE